MVSEGPTASFASHFVLYAKWLIEYEKTILSIIITLLTVVGVGAQI